MGTTAHHSTQPATSQQSRGRLHDELKPGRICYDQDNKLLYSLGVIGDASIQERACAAELDSEKHASTFRDLFSAKSEKDMYSPMVDICNTIIGYKGFGPAKYRRKATTATGRQLISHTNVLPPPKRLPDAAIVDLPPEKPDSDVIEPFSWLHAPVLFEAKLKDDEAPLAPNQRDSTVKQILYQAADYARLHLSLRPFQKFSYILLFHGSSFSISYWDRTGVVCTGPYSLKQERLTFVRLIRRLGCELDPYDLGFDRSVALKNGDTVFTVPYPSYRVWVEAQGPAKSDGPERTGLADKYWVTVGAPVSQSLSYIGRGTTVFKVQLESAQDKTYILKNSWGHGNRTPESTLYMRAMAPENIGVAQFAVGGDVKVRGTRIKCTTRDLRSSKNLPCLDGEKMNATLHRLVLKSVGKPLYTYDDPKSLIRAVRDAIIGHQNLVNHNLLLHRDISAGNVLMSVDPQVERGAAGFVCDIELSKKLPANSPTDDSPELTGTAQFMAIEILDSLIEPEDEDDTEAIAHDIHHDLESFIWVTYYSILCHEIIADRKYFHFKGDEDKFSSFRDLFGRHRYTDIQAAKHAALVPRALCRRLIPTGVLRDLVDQLLDLVAAQNPIRLNSHPVKLTYDDVLAVYNKALDLEV